MAREMKESGISWIGNIPKSWNIVRIKYLPNNDIDSFQDGDWIESPYITDAGIRYLTTGNVGDGIFKRQGIGYITDETFRELNCKYAYPDDLVISRLNAPYGRACILPSDEDKYVLAVDIVILRTDHEKRFICYLMQCDGYQNMVQDNAKGTTMKRISRSNLGNISLPIAPLPEQRIIADYLDTECARIDAVIEQTRASIEEYKKLKQAVITEAVTQGVQPNRQMKDSGVDWIETIPEDWKMIRGKVLFFETNARSVDGSEELLTVSQYTGVTPRSQKNVNMFEAETLEGYKICEVGDIAANTMWMWAGAIGVSQYRGLISPSYNIYRQTSNAFDGRFLDFLLRAVPLVEHYESLSTGIRASRLRLYPQQFLNIRFPVPPLEEQQKIVNYLENTVSEIDKLTDQKDRFISELESYKKSLIYEYVTGKKEVA